MQKVQVSMSMKNIPYYLLIWKQATDKASVIPPNFFANYWSNYKTHVLRNGNFLFLSHVIYKLKENFEKPFEYHFKNIILYFVVWKCYLRPIPVKNVMFKCRISNTPYDKSNNLVTNFGELFEWTYLLFFQIIYVTKSCQRRV